MPEMDPAPAVADLEDEECPDTLRKPPTSTIAAREQLDDVLDALGADEVCVLIRIAERLKHGAHSYGALHVVEDTRAFRDTEAREEIEDALVYLACEWLRSAIQEVTR
jgi:hypothetical protein